MKLGNIVYILNGYVENGLSKFYQNITITLISETQQHFTIHEFYVSVMEAVGNTLELGGLYKYSK